MSKNKIDRREMLKLMGGGCYGLTSNPVKAGLTTILTGIVEKAIATESRGTPRNLVMFQLLNAPSRWTWEPLNPYDQSSQIISNRNVMNKFTGTGAEFTGTEYASVAINGINMPWLWQFDLPTSSGAKPMSDLMDSMLMVKGVNVVNPDHTGATEKQFRPGGTANTITSLTGDVSSRPIPFIGMQCSPNPYSSKAKKAGVNNLSASGNWLDNLLKPFKVNATSFSPQVSTMDSILNQVFANIDRFLKEINANFSSSTSAERDALELIKRDFSSVATEFTTRRDRYRAILKIATAPLPDGMDPLTSLDGINTKAIMVSGVDIRQTLKTNIGSTYITYMAEQFAVIEYVLLNQLSPSLAVGLRAFNQQNFDEHEISPILTTYMNNLWNRGFASCLMELSDQLRAANMWESTLITISGEFGRNPKKTSDGSDHAPEATSMTYLSGCLNGNEIIGNTKRNSENNSYPGTWGMMAENESFGILTSGHIAATTAALLNVDSPVTSSPSLVKLENGTFRGRPGPSKLI